MRFHKKSAKTGESLRKKKEKKRNVLRMQQQRKARAKIKRVHSLTIDFSDVN